MKRICYSLLRHAWETETAAMAVQPVNKPAKYILDPALLISNYKLSKSSVEICLANPHECICIARSLTAIEKMDN
jgi:hypothetical protein